MKILVVGGGGREHAICSKLAKSPRHPEIFCASGNGGIQEAAHCIPISVTDFPALADFAKKEGIDLTVIGMDEPLALGIVDYFEERGLACFGPRKNAAVIEGSKAFAKDLMKKYHIPTAAYETFSDADQALAFLEGARFPLVVKADGLALGKGVLICQSLQEAKEAIEQIMVKESFGTAGSKVVIEEFLQGREVSVLAFVDGKTVRIMSSAQDHKRAGDGDTGLNTGGMGAFSPSPFYTEEVDAYCKEHIYQRTVDAMEAEGRPFQGVLFFGLMLTENGVKVLEYNARFGDPETQVVLPRLKNDLVDVLSACREGTLDQIHLEFEDLAGVCVVLASGGYPQAYQKGYPIRGLEYFKDRTDIFCYHAGTVRKGEDILTAGGRVLGIVALDQDLKQARKKAYEAAGHVDFQDLYKRNDIGKAIDEAKN